jgi:hypothetical protein
MFALVLALVVLASGGTPAYAWTDPAALNTNAGVDTGDDWMSEVTTDGLGHWVAVWKTNDSLGGTIGNDGDIVVSRSTDNGTTWTALAPLNTNAATDTGHDSYPQVTTDGLGHWVAVWESNDSLGNTIGTDGDLLVARSTDNGANWTAPAALNTNPDSLTRDDYAPQVTTDGMGHWVAAWHSIDSEGGPIGTDLDILVARSTNNGATWTAPAPLNTNAATDTGDDTAPQVTTDSLGHWVAVWTSDEDLGGIDTDLDILVSRSTDNGATWTAPAALKNNNGADWCPQVTTDGLGQWVAVWESNTLSGPPTWDDDILISRSTNSGASWTAATALNTSAGSDNTRYDWSPQVTTDGLGHWVAVWDSCDSSGGPMGTDYDILYATEYTPPSAGTLLLTLDSPDPQIGGFFGQAVAVGDVDGDTYADIAVGAPAEDVGGAASDEGQVHVFFGPDGSRRFTLTAPAPQAEASFGSSVAVGDVNGDGKADIVVGARDEDVGGGAKQGRVYVFSGPDGQLLWTLDTPNIAPYGWFGWSVAVVGDVNADGKADIAVGAPGQNVGVNNGAGRAYVFSGVTGQALSTLESPYAEWGGQFGWSVAGVGDLNGDTYPDIAVGAPYEDVGGGESDEGRVSFFSGSGSSPPLDPLFVLESPSPGDGDGHFGFSVAAGDVNNDGGTDIVIGAPQEDVDANSEQGRAYVFPWPQGSSVVTLTTPNPQPSDAFGYSVAVGDVNDDQRGDVVVGTPYEAGGRAHVFAGPNRSLLLTLSSPNPQGGYWFGQSVAVGDVDGNGWGDIAVGSGGEEVDGNTQQGRAYVFSAGELPPGGTEYYHVTFTGAITLDGSPVGTLVAAGTAKVIKGDPYWEGGKQCADYHIESLTLTGTLNDVLVVIAVGEGLTVPGSSGVTCQGAGDFHVTLSLYIEETDHGGSLLSSSPTLATDGHHLCNCWDSERWSSIDCTAVISEVPPNQVTYECATSYQLCNCSTNDPRVTVDTPQTGAFLLAVGGIAEWPGATAGSDQSAPSSSGSGFNYIALGGALAAAAIVVLAAGACLARRRWAR